MKSYLGAIIFLLSMSAGVASANATSTAKSIIGFPPLGQSNTKAVDLYIGSDQIFCSITSGSEIGYPETDFVTVTIGFLLPNPSGARLDYGFGGNAKINIYNEVPAGTPKHEACGLADDVKEEVQSFKNNVIPTVVTLRASIATPMKIGDLKYLRLLERITLKLPSGIEFKGTNFADFYENDPRVIR